LNLHSIKLKMKSIYLLYLFFAETSDNKKMIGEMKSFGEENSEKTFLVIRLNNPFLGLMAIYNCVLGYLRIAERNGFIPVVDLKNYANGYLEDEEIGKINAWEYYFEQPTSYTLEEVYRSKNVVFGTGVSPREASPAILNLLLSDKKKASYYYDLSNKYLRIKDSILEEISRDCQNLIGGKRVIGVSSRGSDMINLKGHAIQPSTSALMAKTKGLLVKWNCDYVFLATEENHVIEDFREEFGDKLLINDSFRISEFEVYKPFVNISSNRENDKFLKGLEYLNTILILSECNSLVGTVIGKTVGAISLNKGTYENKYFFELGLY
jgi:hypothetical protein